MLSIDKLHVNVHQKTLLKDINFDLASNQWLALIGPNGAGKSTLLKTLSGDIDANSGTITYDKQNIKDYREEQLARYRGVLLQEYHIPFPLSAREVVMLGAIPHRHHLDHKQCVELATHDMQLSDTLSIAEQPFDSLSGGEKQRIHIARLLTQITPTLSDRTCILLDEPVSAMDWKNKVRMLRLFSDLQRQGAAIICIMHDLNMALEFSSHTLLLKNGRLIQTGKTKELLISSYLDQTFDAHFDFAESKNAPDKKIIFQQ